MAVVETHNGTSTKDHQTLDMSKSFNNWPNDAGFDVFHEEINPVELKVSGRIPSYAAGILYRTGPGGYQVGTSQGTTFSISHWFDGFAQTHRFEIVPPTTGNLVTRVVYNSRHTCNNYVEEIRKTGDLSSITFGQKQDPCSSFFGKVSSSFRGISQRDREGASDANVNVTVHPNMPGRPLNDEQADHDAKSVIAAKVNKVWLKTDANSMQEIDFATLEPLGVVDQRIFHPELRGVMSCAHSCTDPLTGDMYNYNLEFGRQAVYRIFCVSARTGETTILATLSGGDIGGAYIHSILLTQRYVILCIFDSYYAKGGMQILWTKNVVDAIEFNPNKKNKWLVVDRLHGKGLVGVFRSDPFFAFHCVNAWDTESETEPGKVDIFAEIPIYENLDVLKRFYYENMKGTSKEATDYTGEKGQTSRASLTRWKLPSVGNITVPAKSRSKPAERVFCARKEDSMELPTFNPKYATKPSRYIYGVSDRGNSTFLDGLIKFDTLTQTAEARIIHAQSPGEPIFVPDPEGVDEDDGILMSVVLDGTQGKSYLLVLDAKSFTELGRAEMEIAFPFGFHGAHVAA